MYTNEYLDFLTKAIELLIRNYIEYLKLFTVI